MGWVLPAMFALGVLPSLSRLLTEGTAAMGPWGWTSLTLSAAGLGLVAGSAAVSGWGYRVAATYNESVAGRHDGKQPA